MHFKSLSKLCNTVGDELYREEITSGGGGVGCLGREGAGSRLAPRKRLCVFLGECRTASVAFKASRWAASLLSRFTIRFAALCFCNGN